MTENDVCHPGFPPPEDLHPDLKSHLVQSEALGPMVQHPLLYAVPYFKELNGHYNRQYEAKKREVDKGIERKDWSRVLAFVERPYRLIWFYQFKDRIVDDSEYWELLSSLYQDSENIHEVSNLLHVLLTAERGNAEKMMDATERDIFKNLPDRFRVYRGHTDKNRLGVSWTLSYVKAVWFANRFDQKGDVSMAFVDKKNVMAYLSGRSEYEIVVRQPILIKKIRRIPKIKMPPKMISVFRMTLSRFKLGNYSDHGQHHWINVYRIGQYLCERMGYVGSNRQVVELFALIHDHLRENEMVDPDHGYRAAQMIPEILSDCKINLDKSRIDLLMDAVRYHNEGWTTKIPLIGTCWDSDRLDLPRVGIIPDPALLSTDVAKESILRI